MLYNIACKLSRNPKSQLHVRLVISTVYILQSSPPVEYQVTTAKSGQELKAGCQLKVHKIKNFFGSDFKLCTISLLVLLKY